MLLGVPKSATGLRGSKSVTFDQYFICTTDHFWGGLALRENDDPQGDPQDDPQDGTAGISRQINKVLAIILYISGLLIVNEKCKRSFGGGNK